MKKSNIVNYLNGLDNDEFIELIQQCTQLKEYIRRHIRCSMAVNSLMDSKKLKKLEEYENNKHRN